MAYDDRYSGRRRGFGWRGDPAFGDGWGNQVPRLQRPGSRWRGPDDDPYVDAERYGPGEASGDAVGDYGPIREAGDLHYGGPGYDAGFGGPRFDRVDVGSVGTHGVHPVSPLSGSAFGFGPRYGTAARDAALRHHDPRYAEWRHRQIAALDQDYEEYRRETQARFDDEFSAWRSRRGAQREAIGRVDEHMEVLGSDGGHVGTVDKVSGDTLILTRSDPGADGVHRAIPCGWIDRVEDKVTLNITGEEVTRRWRTEGRSRALFERPDSGSDGPHVLNRSFSGTYPGKE